jgi:hypothetical protein
MNKEDIQKLIGGYATGSLTDEERQALFEAALDDQELFDTLQQEQALKDLFDDPFSREQVRRAAAESLPRPRTSWFRRPWIWASATSMALAGVLVIAMLRWDRTASPPVAKQATEASKQVAEASKPPAAAAEQPQDLDKSASKPKPEPVKAVAGKPQVHQTEVATLDDKRSGTSKESAKESEAGRGGFAVESRRSNASGRLTNSGDKPNTNSLGLAQNRESAPAPVNTAEAPRKDVQAAAPPPPSPQVQLARARQESGPSQAAQSQQVQVQAQAPGVPVATAVPNLASRSRDLEEKQRATATKTETSDELTKSAGSDQRKAKGGGSAFGLAKKAAAPQASFYLFARRSEDGSYAGVSTDTVFRTGDNIRVTIAPHGSGPLSIWESDSTNPEWRRLFPAERDSMKMRAKRDYAIPVDIVVEKDQRLRVMTGSTATYIPIRSEGAAVK